MISALRVFALVAALVAAVSALRPEQARRIQLLRDDVYNTSVAVTNTWIADEEPTDLAWSWGEGVLVFGIFHSHLLTQDPAYYNYVKEYTLYHQEREVRIFWSDKTTPAITASEMVLRNDTSVKEIVDRVVFYVSEEAPRTEEQGLIKHLGKLPLDWLPPRFFPDIWIDSLFHWVPTLCRQSVITGNDTYLIDGADQLLGFIRNLQDPTTDLMTHAYNDMPRDEQIPSFASEAFWARGNGWMIATLVDLLEFLPASYQHRAELIDRMVRHEAALCKYQTERGLYRTVLMDADTYEETAGSALITYGMIRGYADGWFGEETLEAGVLGMEGLMSTIERDGDRAEVSGTSIGTNPRELLYQFIPQRNQVSYGVGSWLMAAYEFLQLEI